jgi:hypothetical protein
VPILDLPKAPPLGKASVTLRVLSRWIEIGRTR